MRKPSVYIETTIVSYLAARPSPSLFTAACQQITMDWWEERRSGFELFTSEIVMLEARSGDPDAVIQKSSQRSEKSADLWESPALRFVLRSRLWRSAMVENEILKEVWRSRDAFAKRHKYNLDAMVEELRQMERQSRNKMVDRSGESAKKTRRRKRQRSGR